MTPHAKHKPPMHDEGEKHAKHMRDTGGHQ